MNMAGQIVSLQLFLTVIVRAEPRLAARRAVRSEAYIVVVCVVLVDFRD